MNTSSSRLTCRGLAVISFMNLEIFYFRFDVILIEPYSFRILLITLKTPKITVLVQKLRKLTYVTPIFVTQQESRGNTNRSWPSERTTNLLLLMPTF